MQKSEGSGLQKSEGSGLRKARGQVYILDRINTRVKTCPPNILTLLDPTLFGPWEPPSLITEHLPIKNVTSADRLFGARPYQTCIEKTDLKNAY